MKKLVLFCFLNILIMQTLCISTNLVEDIDNNYLSPTLIAQSSHDLNVQLLHTKISDALSVNTNFSKFHSRWEKTILKVVFVSPDDWNSPDDVVVISSYKRGAPFSNTLTIHVLKSSFATVEYIPMKYISTPIMDYFIGSESGVTVFHNFQTLDGKGRVFRQDTSEMIYIDWNQESLTKANMKFSYGCERKLAEAIKHALHPIEGSLGVIGVGNWGSIMLNNILKIAGQNVHVHASASNATYSEVPVSYYEQWQRKKEEGSITNLTLHEKSDYQTIIQNPEIQSVFITGDNKTHYAIAKEALEAGKNVYLEKPPTQTVKQLEELHALAEQHDCVFVVGYEYFYDYNVRILRNLIESREMGDIKKIEIFMLNPFAQNKRFDMSSDVLGDLALHMLCCVEVLLGTHNVENLMCTNNGEHAVLEFTYNDIPIKIEVNRKHQKDRYRKIFVKGQRLNVELDYAAGTFVVKDVLSGATIPEGAWGMQGEDYCYPMALNKVPKPPSTLEGSITSFLRKEPMPNSVPNTRWISVIMEQHTQKMFDPIAMAA